MSILFYVQNEVISLKNRFSLSLYLSLFFCILSRLEAGNNAIYLFTSPQSVSSLHWPYHLHTSLTKERESEWDGERERGSERKNEGEREKKGERERLCVRERERERVIVKDHLPLSLSHDDGQRLPHTAPYFYCIL